MGEESGQRTAEPESKELRSWGRVSVAAEDHWTAVQVPVTAARYLAASCPDLGPGSGSCLERTPAGCPGLILFRSICPRRSGCPRPAI